MKFSEMSKDSWAELQLYMDTCLIPYTALSGESSPAEATEALERLRDFLDLVEIPFKGRIMTYPAVHYTFPEMSRSLNLLAEQLKASGFKFVVIMSADGELNPEQIPAADLVLCCSEGIREAGEQALSTYIGEKIRELWRK